MALSRKCAADQGLAAAAHKNGRKSRKIDYETG
jgi:hypothetical protein